MTDTNYWATLPTQELAAEVERKASAYYHALEGSGRLEVWRKAVQTYFGLDEYGEWKNSVAVTYGGEQGELSMIRVNEFRSLVRHTLVLITGSRPAFQARARNGDYTSRLQAQLAESLIDYYMDEEQLEDVAVQVAEYALLLGEGWYGLTWDFRAGDPVAVSLEVDEQGQPVEHTQYAGDVCAKALQPIEVIRDIQRPSAEDHDWIVVRHRVKRWDLIAQYPEHSEALRMADGQDMHLLWRTSSRSLTADRGEDFVTVYELFHARTPALPEGRYALIVGETVLQDTALPYDEIPVHPMMPATEIDTAFGYTTTWDLLPLQEALDSIMSAELTNQDAVGVINFWTSKLSDLSPRDLGGGLRVIESDEKPEILDHGSRGDAGMKLLDQVRDFMQSLRGINDTARGNPDPNVKSGAMAALLHTMASQYNSGEQRCYGRLLERVATALIRLLQTFADHPRLVEITGKTKAPALREFTGADLASVHRVAVDLGNAMTRTAAGKQELANQLVASFPDAITPEQYLEVMATGRLDPVYDAPRAKRNLVAQENEALLEGRDVKSMVTDDHQLHIQEHAALLADPEIRFQDDVVQRVVAHIMEHKQQWMGADPVILEATGQAPPQAMAMMAPPPGGPPGPGGPGAPMPNPEGPPAPNIPGGEIPANELQGQQQAGMPDMPINPLTGAPAEPGTPPQAAPPG